MTATNTELQAGPSGSVSTKQNSAYIFASVLAAVFLTSCTATGGNVPVTAVDKVDTTHDRVQEAPAAQSVGAPSQPPLKQALPKSSAAKILLARANTALASKEPRTAIMLLERAVRIEPRESLLWVRLSKAHLEQGDQQTAFQHARKAIALAGSDRSQQTAAWLQLASVYEAQGRQRDAQNIRQRYQRGSG
ncbi:MAG TPA: hypothetical protein DE147_05170 [Gammaproteobacteria bacterium]|nr:hypothetical protein [Gammaproteobacteria bacterium]